MDSGKGLMVSVDKKSTSKNLEEKDVKELKERRTVYMKLISLCHSAYVSSLALYALTSHERVSDISYAVMSMDNSAYANDAVFGHELVYIKSKYAHDLVPITIAFFIYEMVLINQWKDQPGLMPMVIHHILSIILFPLATVYNTGHWWLLLFLSYEASTPFLCFKHLIERFLGKQHISFKINGILLALSFVVIRNLTAPAILYSFYHTIPHMDNKLVLILAIASIIPVILNAIWGSKLIKGVIKVIKSMGNVKKEE
eukprot:CAMPEP_0204843672 /NCGR_PEP_ID=MMETSP1346-20131115/48118_1 /ASSEMBLY_ACC=CAM_ASM_000771 /TAXON_ID=215587 /ORGANISM="Aplanochytrium stocchinoi, Strain GSBS06" /LENGTH=255 /DNA_ID=CAMNT_0051982857 /DNA_START=510 /DNA_END=1277 /DNA_ORIENTATION=-